MYTYDPYAEPKICPFMSSEIITDTDPYAPKYYFSKVSCKEKECMLWQNNRCGMLPKKMKHRGFLK
jgi:hypothetical protein